MTYPKGAITLSYNVECANCDTADSGQTLSADIVPHYLADIGWDYSHDEPRGWNCPKCVKAKRREARKKL